MSSSDADYNASNLSPQSTYRKQARHISERAAVYFRKQVDEYYPILAVGREHLMEKSANLIFSLMHWLSRFRELFF